MTRNSPTVAVFDLDKTLTRRDTFLSFLGGYLRRHPLGVWRLALLPLTLPVAVARATKEQNRRTRIKQAVLRAFVGGAPRAQVDAWGRLYAERVVDGGLRPYCLAALREHLSSGDRVLLATASFDVYVEPLARYLGIEEVVCSRIDWSGKDRVRGIDGGNCLAREKLRRVQALIGADGASVIAYSDSHADLPLLAWAERGVAVSPSPKLAREAGDLGLEVRAW